MEVQGTTLANSFPLGSWLVVPGTASVNSFPFMLPMMGLGTDRLVLCPFLQGDEGDFRSGTDAGREDGLA